MFVGLSSWFWRQGTGNGKSICLVYKEEQKVRNNEPSSETEPFSLAGRAVWNSLPESVRSTNTLVSFNRNLKTHLFNIVRSVFDLLLISHVTIFRRFLSFFLSVCLSVCSLSVSLFLFLFSSFLSIYLHVSLYLSISLSVSQSVCQSVCIIYLSNLSIYLSI